MKSLMSKLEELMEMGGIRKDVTLLIVGGVSLALSLMNSRLHFAILPFDIAWVAILLCGVPIILEAIIGLVMRFDIKADVLVSLALIASILICQYFAAGEVAVIMRLGELLEELTVHRARTGIERLVHLAPQTARVVSDVSDRIIDAQSVRVGDILLVLPGETVPADGIIISGQTSIDQSVMTGEPMPVDKTVGDEVSCGTTNQFGAFKMRAEKDGKDSSIRRMIRLVQSADAGKAKIVRLADRWATWIVIVALSAATLTWAISGEIIRAVTILVVFCPCAFALATPTAIMAAIGNATKHGFLVREGDALERLAKVNWIVFDKTGTLTYGTPAVTAVKSVSHYSEDEIFAFAAAAESFSEHPLGKAIVKSYGKDIPPSANFHMSPGEGVSAEIAGRTIHAGNRRFLSRIGTPVEEISDAQASISEYGTVIFVAIDRRLAGYLVLSDTLREDAPKMVRELISFGIAPALLTGDNKKAASFVASELGICDMTADCLPEDKIAAIDAMRENGDFICMVGDGINDAPALKRADVGIAMGEVGSDIAVEAADIVLVNDEIGGLAHLLALSKRMMTAIRLNLIFSMTLNFIATALAATGMLGPVIGALMHNAGSFLVIMNSVLLLKWERKTR